MTLLKAKFHATGWAVLIGVVAAAVGLGTAAPSPRPSPPEGRGSHWWPAPRILVPDPGAPGLLVSEGGGRWIGVDEPFNLAVHLERDVFASFRKRFRIEARPQTAVLTVRAFKSAAVFLDGESLLEPDEDLRNWTSARQVDIADRLSPGEHWLLVTVRNENGPAALLAYCDAIGIFTSNDWQASRDGQTWSRALVLDQYRPVPLSRKFLPAHQAFLGCLPLLAPVFALAFYLSLKGPQLARWWLSLRNPDSSALPFQGFFSVAGLRWLLLAAWVVLGLNNFGKIPARVGFDIEGHMKYVKYVAENARIPLASEGWQMFQPPLYYLLVAPFFRMLAALMPDQIVWVWRLLRFVSLACGAAQVELCYRALRSVFPSRSDLQAIGLVIGGLLPMNIYLSQSIGNEALAGCLSSAILVLCLKLLGSGRAPLLPCSSTHHSPVSVLPCLGVLLGLAILTKTTAVLLVPPVAVLVAYWLYRSQRRAPQILGGTALVLGVALVLSGWYYLRNWYYLGSPFVGGWDPTRGIVWWQEPGYRTPSHFLRFGESLVYPVYSGISGIWDALYSTFWLDGWLSSVCVYELRPPWNYDFLISGAWLALLPATGMLLGIVLAICRPALVAAHGLRFAVSLIAIYVAAVLVLYLKLPIYSTAKATYTIGILPCYAIVGAAGLSIFLRGPVSRSAVYAGLACWAIAGYLAYFVV